MSDEWRQFLYPLGLLSSIAFTARFLLQWLKSEKEQKSVVTETFWKLSLLGNLLLLIHSLLQIQYHVCLVQACNAVISWRNLNLMQPLDKHYKLSFVIALFFISLTSVTLIFMLQTNIATWFRVPIAFWSSSKILDVSTLWHSIGFLGLILHNSRFWIQWWGAERQGISYLGPAFWWISLAGASLCIIYFLHIRDFVNLVGPLFGIIPYVRNLMILAKSKNISIGEKSP